MTDITELAHGNSLHKKLNRRLNDAYGFQRTSGGKHTTISLSIAECKSVIAALEKHLALVDALEKAQETIAFQQGEIKALLSSLESRTVKLPKPKNSDQGWKIDPEFINKVQDAIGYDDTCECWEGTPSMELVEAVLLAAAGIKVEAE